MRTGTEARLSAARRVATFPVFCDAPTFASNLLIFRGFSNKQPAFPAGITRGL
jgi:hypothetical protein